MTLRRLAPMFALVLAGCSGGMALPPPPVVPTPAANRAPTTAVNHPLSARQRIDDHAARLADGVARYREVSGSAMPQSMRDLAITMGADGRPCFTEILKDHWFQPYAYSVVDERSGRFQLTSAGANGQFGDGDDLTAVRGPGDARVETYGFTARAGE